MRGFLTLPSLVAIVGVAAAAATPAVAASSQGALLSTVRGSYLAMPRLGLRVQVGRSLDTGPIMWFRDSDTVVISGHRTTHTAPFRHLERLRRGDRITYGRHTYSVVRKRLVRPWEVWVHRYTGLVLTACHPPGSDDHRIAVFAREVTP